MGGGSSGTFREGSSAQQQVCAAANNNNNNNSSSSSSYNGDHQWGVPSFQHQQSISMDWTHDEQAILEEGLAKYSNESNIIRYAKIAVQLRNKTVRDIALRCRWMTKKEMNKRRKDDINARKTKDRKENGNENCSTKSGCSRLGMIQSSLSHSHAGIIPTINDNTLTYNIDNIGGPTRQLLQQNVWSFKQISSNIATNQIHENIGLLSQARDNLFKILTNLNEMGPTLKKMPPLPKLNEELANSILPPPPTHFPIRLS